MKEFLLNNMIDQSDSATEGSNMEDYMDAHLCNAPYSSSSKSKEPFGPGGIWKYEETNYKKIDGRHTNYDGSGFIVHLSTDPDTFTEQTEFLKDNKWTDKSTRALTIIVTIVNPSTNTYTVGEFLLELPRGGDYLATPHYFVYRADLYARTCSLLTILLFCLALKVSLSS